MLLPRTKGAFKGVGEGFRESNLPPPKKNKNKIRYKRKIKKLSKRDLGGGGGMVWYGNCLFDKIKSTLKHNSKYIFYLFVYFFIYNQIPPQSEENSILHKNSIDKILVKQVYLT